MNRFRYLVSNNSLLVLSEFVGRLLLWLRFPTLAILVPKDLFGLLALIIGADVLASQATANTSVKLLLSERISVRQGLQGIVMCSPLILGVVFIFPFFTTVTITLDQSFILFGAGIMGASSYFLLFFLRIFSTHEFVLARVISSIIIFAGSVLILPVIGSGFF